MATVFAPSAQFNPPGYDQLRTSLAYFSVTHIVAMSFE
jgi:hypothetical protein